MNDDTQWKESPRQIADTFLARYCQLLDEARLEEWADLFAQEGCYQVRSRENEEQGLPAAILLLETRDAIVDRISALEKTAVYNIHYARRFYSGVKARMQPDGLLALAANICVYQTDQDGHSRLFCVGRYQGTVADGGFGLIRQFTVCADTFTIPTLLAVPL